MEENTQVQEQVEVKKRPAFLTVLCILTYIGSGLGLLFGILAIVAAGAIAGLLESIPGMSQLEGTGMVMIIVSALLSAISLFGAVMMWQLKKLGFYIYVVAQIAMVATSFSVMGLIFALLFIVLYFLNFKHME